MVQQKPKRTPRRTAQRGPLVEHLLCPLLGCDLGGELLGVEAAVSPRDVLVVGDVGDRPVSERAEKLAVDALDQAAVVDQVVAAEGQEVGVVGS